MGFLGQFICGGIFYLALTMTTAANGILIYSSVPAMIVLIERIFLGRALVHRQLVGIAMASARTGQASCAGRSVAPWR